jgi:DNA excision repair protein ERCC-2
MCPYEITAMIASRAHVIIADYHYLFHPHVRNVFLTKTGKRLEDCVVVVDEAHNLPDRIRETLTVRLSSNNLRHAIKEAKKYNEKAIGMLVHVQEVLNSLAGRDAREKRVPREALVDGIGAQYD